MQEIKVELTKQPKAKPTDETKLGFGSIFTDHMFVMNYDEGKHTEPRTDACCYSVLRKIWPA